MKTLPDGHDALNLQVSTFAFYMNVSFQKGKRTPPNEPIAKAFMFPISKYQNGITVSKQTCLPVHAVDRILTALLGQLSAVQLLVPGLSLQGQ